MNRTPAKFVHDWLTNLVILVPLLSGLGGAAIYGNSDTVKKMIHGSPLTVDGKPEVTPINYDRIIKDLIELNKQQDIKIGKLQEWHE